MFALDNQIILACRQLSLSRHQAYFSIKKTKQNKEYIYLIALMSLCSPDNPVIKMGKMAGGQLPKGFDLFWTDNFCYKNFREFFFLS